MVEMAKGAKAAGAAMWVGIGEGEELKSIIETGAKTIKDMGTVMKESMARSAGQADGKILSEVIKSKLSFIFFAASK